MRVFEDPKSDKKRIKSKTVGEHLRPPEGAPGPHKVDLPQSFMGWLKVPVNRVADMVVIPSGLEGRENPEPPVPFPSR